MKIIKNKAFTLAETMLTLVIIGVLVALVMPMLNISFRRNTMQAGFVDATKTINSALYNYSAKNSCNGKLACTDLFREGSNSAEKLATVFKSATSKKDCWGGKDIPNKINGGSAADSTDMSNFQCIVDGAGKFFAILNFENDCTSNIGNNANGDAPPTKLSKACGYVYFDVNGIEKPNRFGVDVFIYAITDNPQTYLYPVGGEFWKDDVNFPSVQDCTVNGEGRTCAGKIVKDGMRIKYFE